MTTQRPKREDKSTQQIVNEVLDELEREKASDLVDAVVAKLAALHGDIVTEEYLGYHLESGGYITLNMNAHPRAFFIHAHYYDVKNPIHAQTSLVLTELGLHIHHHPSPAAINDDGTPITTSDQDEKAARDALNASIDLAAVDAHYEGDTLPDHLSAAATGTNDNTVDEDTAEIINLFERVLRVDLKHLRVSTRR